MAAEPWQLALGAATATAACYLSAATKPAAKMPKLSWSACPGEFAVIRMTETVPWPGHVAASKFLSVTRTVDETSVVLEASLAGQFPASDACKVETGWVMFRLEGPLDFGLVGARALLPSPPRFASPFRAACESFDCVCVFSHAGILARIASVLAGEGISIFAVSTYDTDYVLIKQDKEEECTAALAAAGYTWE